MRSAGKWDEEADSVFCEFRQVDGVLSTAVETDRGVGWSTLLFGRRVFRPTDRALSGSSLRDRASLVPRPVIQESLGESSRRSRLDWFVACGIAILVCCAGQGVRVKLPRG